MRYHKEWGAKAVIAVQRADEGHPGEVTLAMRPCGVMLTPMGTAGATL